MKPTTEEPAGTQTTMAAVVNVALDTGTMVEPAKNKNTAIFDQEDVSFDQ